jgi:hypothetical protein
MGKNREKTGRTSGMNGRHFQVVPGLIGPAGAQVGGRKPMSLLKMTPPEEAAGGMKRIYDSFSNAMGMIPPPLIASSTSPVLQALLASCLIYYNEHRTLSQKLIAHIRYCTSVIFDLPQCTAFSKSALRLHGLNDHEIERLRIDPDSAELKEKEKMIFSFCIKAIRDPESVSQEDIRRLKDVQWTDSDIFDALNVMAVMVGPGLVMKALKVK